MAKQRTEQPTAQELWVLLREQQDALREQRTEIAQLRALVDHRDEYKNPAMYRDSVDPHQVVSRAGLLKAAAMGAAGVAGAGTLLQNGAGVAGATGAEGQTTFSSSTTTPTVTVNNTSTGLAIKTSGSIQSSKGVTAKTVTATNPSTAANANAVVGQISSTSAGSLSAGVRGQSLSTSANGIGVYGSQSGIGIGVHGEVSGGGFGGTFVASNTGGVGVYGSGDTAVSGVGTTYGGNFTGEYGVYGYSSHVNGNGVYGEADDGTSIPYGVWGLTTNSKGYGVFSDGNMGATGTKSAVVPTADGSHRKLYCVESPECWFEDFGSAQLVNGHALVTIDPVFAGVVHTDLFHIFLTANGDSKGLYVSNRTATGFEVREQEGGKSTLSFSYRVVARRKDVVAPRLEQVTIKERPAQPTPRKPVLDPNPNANVVQDPTA